MHVCVYVCLCEKQRSGKEKFLPFVRLFAHSFSNSYYFDMTTECVPTSVL